ncbi:PIG-L deacetylase family protein [Gulosibacter molinativorax]|uniref:GlcNAc-PI de-N-acetylase n=1 Tax=Gulosibacter molinativorax TaxID=256821 RepID=A0ABT7C6E2_9MICO|nr:hypothetical protein [Gulosibacter molinativorax]MDJ1370749.1 hypothetical protein [Gulosibacter molinativorax]QUY63224.1 Hypotetical protein [Gulosibacter molinativorax]
MPTVLALHAATADVPLLTGSTIARLTEEGRRVVIVTLTGDAPTAIAQSLGAARAESLGYELALESESKVPVAEATDRIQTLLADEEIDLILSYDKIGVVHEPTHVRVHEIGNELASRLGAPTVEAAITRELVNKGAGVAKTLRKTVPYNDEQLAQFASKSDLAYDIPAKKKFDVKWDAMKAAGGGADRFSQLLARGMQFPKLVVGSLFQHEYFGAGQGQAPDWFTSLAK